MSLYLGSQIISGGSAPTRNIGQVISSTLPLTDAGLHLLDGALIGGSGSYRQFVNYIADLYTADPTANYFTTEANWQTAVTTYGVCGKFVYDSVANTVRLPKITGFVEGASGIANLGDLVEAGLPNITGTTASTITQSGLGWTSNGALYGSRSGNGNVPNSTTSGTYNNTINLDASLSSSIYGNSSTVQPQAIKVLYYIVVATTTKTDIEVDIDEIATDLNGKADVDLTNLSNTGKIANAHNAMPSGTYKDLTLGASGTSYTADADGYILFGKKSSASNQTIGLYVYSSGGTELGGTKDIATATDQYLYIFLPVSKGQTFKPWYNAGGATDMFRLLYCIGSESEAS